MIQAASLRLGNIIQDGYGKYHRVSGVGMYPLVSGVSLAYIDTLEQGYSESEDVYFGVPLDSALLERCGFKDRGSEWYLDIESYNTVRFCFHGPSATVETYLPGDNSGFGKDITYLHELQNLFYSLTGEELSVHL